MASFNWVAAALSRTAMGSLWSTVAVAPTVIEERHHIHVPIPPTQFHTAVYGVYACISLLQMCLTKRSPFVVPQTCGPNLRRGHRSGLPRSTKTWPPREERTTTSKCACCCWFEKSTVSDETICGDYECSLTDKKVSVRFDHPFFFDHWIALPEPDGLDSAGPVSSAHGTAG